MNRRTRIFTYKMIAGMILIPAVALALFGCFSPTPSSAPTPAVNNPDVNSQFTISKIVVDGYEVTCLLIRNSSGAAFDCDWQHHRQLP